jgi:uracil-DNA glycosylase family 4
LTPTSTGSFDSPVDPAGGDSGWNSIEEIADVVRSCTNCRLHAGRTNAVPGDGSPVASILIIGEGPGFNEDQQGLPFVGRSGKLLDELLAEVPLSRQDVFITNVVKCRPPDNRDPKPDEVAACRPYLERQIELLDPKVIVTLGRHSFLRFYPEGKISKDHGKILRWNDRILFPLYHPAAGLRNPAIKLDLQADVLRLPEALRESLSMSATASAKTPVPVPENVQESQPGPKPELVADHVQELEQETEPEQEPEPEYVAESIAEAAVRVAPPPPEPVYEQQPEPADEDLPPEPTATDSPTATESTTESPLPSSPPADSPEERTVGAPVSEPIIENETTEKEEGDRQLGFF